MRRLIMSIVTIVAATLGMFGSAVPASAVPPPPPNPSAQDVAAADTAVASAKAAVSTAAAEVTKLDQSIGQLEAQVEAATDAHLMAEAQLQAATSAVETTAAQRELAAADLIAAQADLSQLARLSYMDGGAAYDDMLLFTAQSPTDLIERSGLLDSIAAARMQVLDQMKVAQVNAANANSAAEQAVLDQQTAEQAAADALADVTEQLDTASATLSVLQQQMTTRQAALNAAQEKLFELQNAQVTYQEWAAAKAAEEAAAQAAAAQKAAAQAVAAMQAPDPPAETEAQAAESAEAESEPSESEAPPPQPAPAQVPAGGWALPVGGVLTSCFCERWGTMHWGIDIAAPMYTPIYAAGDGVVIRAGEASGFGLAVYIEHANGDVTVYGHMEVITAEAGQSVAGGELIAKVGSRGFSTGPHLHFEVHSGGLYADRVDPVAWLADRGVTL